MDQFTGRVLVEGIAGAREHPVEVFGRFGPDST